MFIPVSVYLHLRGDGAEGKGNSCGRVVVVVGKGFGSPFRISVHHGMLNSTLYVGGERD